MIIQKEIEALNDYLDKNVNNELIIARSFLENFISLFGENQQYRAIGTVEECREARERQRGKKPIKGRIFKSLGYYQCQICGGLFMRNEKFCSQCGQAIDYSE